MAKKRIVKASTTKLGDNKTILGTFTGKCCDAAVFNNNSMKLDRALFEKLMDSDEYKDGMEHRYYIGFLGHPEDPNCQDFKDACIVMTSMEIKPNDEVYGTFDLIDTPVGRVVKTFIDAGVQFGISIRGAGDVDAEGNVDPDTFVFRGFDLVAFPAYGDAVPEFQQIAASKNLDDQVKYKRVCAAIDKNIDKVDSINCIEEMQKQFRADSAESKKLEARKANIGVDDECPECSEEEKEEIMAKKLRAMTDMYLDEVECNKELQATLASTKKQYKREIESIKRITASQNKLMQAKLDTVLASNQEATEKQRKLITANRQLSKQLREAKDKNSEINSELSTLRKNNLNYKQKIESSSADIKARDEEIAELRSKLTKTVVASTNATNQASNRGEQIEDLKAKISSSKKEYDREITSLENRILATEELLCEYQQAYANIYANAIGTRVSGLQVTAATTVSDLENLIQGATNSANIGINPSFGYEEEEVFLPAEVDNFGEDTDSGLVVL